MTVFPPHILDELQRLPHAEHSFLKQLATHDGSALREKIDRILNCVPEPVSSRWREVLSSLDNRRFFQAFSEILTVELLLQKGWSIQDLSWPGPSLLMQTPEQKSFHVLVLAFLHQLRPSPDQETINRLIRVLNRVQSRTRIVVLVRRWIEHDFDPEPVRQAVDMWLREVDRNGSRDRYAVYSDEHVSLEFALTGERARSGHDMVAFSLGPFSAMRSIEIVERRMLVELDAWRMGKRASDPLLISVVSDQPWRISPGYIRELLYGKPVWMSTGAHFEMAFSSEFTPSIFRDPHYSTVAGLILAERPSNDPTQVQAKTYLNPWTRTPLPKQSCPGPTLDAQRTEGNSPVMRWF